MQSKKPEHLKNQFFDINKFPKEEGILLFPISMSRISNSQTAPIYIEFLKGFLKKISAPKIGVNILYGDYLYLHSSEKAAILKNTFMHQVVNHKNALQKLIFKNRIDFQIQHGFSYMNWGDLYFGITSFPELFDKIKKIYNKDKLFQKYLKEDCAAFKKRISQNQINFFLEEHLMTYLLTKGQIKLPNEYILGREQWILSCYPGKPPKGMVYLFQLNPLKLSNPKNPYENCPTYDLKDKKLYDANNIDLATYDPR
ncbi:MAG: hypothetical protein MUD00_01935 [Candidatus Pacebacteria bacterium]|jgi:hypothetical protein|nr:hypothetical protein [Candidatus Paceibacterota bacterium]